MTAVLLSFEADDSDNLGRGYPDEILLSGDVRMEDWRPAEAQVEARTLRAASDVDGPSIHPRVRSLVHEEIVLLVDDTTVIQQISRLLNAINAGTASGWLRAQRLGEDDVWRSPVRGGSIQLSGASWRYNDLRRLYFVTIFREPWFESTAAPTSLGTHALRTRTAITLTAPASGTLAAPLILTLRASGDVNEALRLHLFQDRAAPSSWTPNYRCAGIGTLTGGDLRFTTVRPSGKNLGRATVYRPILTPTSSDNHVADERGDEAFSLAYGASSTVLWAETDLGQLGYVDGRDSIFTALGWAEIDEDVDYLRLRSHARPFTLDTGWQLHMAPSDGCVCQVVTGTGALIDGPLYLAPSERCVILPFIETVAAAEYSGTALSLQASIRPRISTIF